MNLNYDLFAPYKFSLDVYQFSLLINEVFFGSNSETNDNIYTNNSICCRIFNMMYPTNRLRNECIINDINSFKSWNFLYKEIQKDVLIDINVNREINVCNIKRKFIDYLTEYNMVLFIPLENVKLFYSIFKDKNSDMISNGTIDVAKGEVLFVKPNSYISSRQIIDCIMIIIYADYDKKCFLKTQKYDDVFLI